MTTAPESTDDSEFTISRLFEAPLDLVFSAYSESARLAKWWTPAGLATLACDVDLRPGGVFRYGMRAPDGGEMWGQWVFRDIVPPERLQFVVSFTDAAGIVVRHPMSAEWPLEVLSTMSFESQGGKTLVTGRAVPINANEDEVAAFKAGHDSMRMGWKGALDQLDAYLAGATTASERDPREFVMSRVFTAPRDLVFKALTEPGRLVQWFGPRAWPLAFCEVDLRVGGAWRYGMRGPEGEEAWGKGVYEEVTPPSRIAYTDYFTDSAGNVLTDLPAARASFELDEVEGGTRLTTRGLYPTEESLQQVLAMGLEAGMAETWDLLAEHLKASTRGELGVITASRAFDAPRDAVFRAYVEPEQFVRHFAPEGMTIPLASVTIDARPGGAFACVMVFEEDGSEHPIVGTFVEAVEPERLAFTEHGMGLTSTMTFRDIGGKTELTVRQTNVPVEYLGPEAAAGFESSFDLLERHLRKLQKG